MGKAVLRGLPRELDLALAVVDRVGEPGAQARQHLQSRINNVGGALCGGGGGSNSGSRGRAVCAEVRGHNAVSADAEVRGRRHAEARVGDEGRRGVRGVGGG